MAKKSAKPARPVDSIKHKDKRSNIPTKELSDFIADDEAKPKSATFPGPLCARDPSLDPQLVRKGKDEQDREPLTVPAGTRLKLAGIQTKTLVAEGREVDHLDLHSLRRRLQHLSLANGAEGNSCPCWYLAVPWQRWSQSGFSGAKWSPNGHK